MGPRTKNSAKNIFFSEVSFAVILILQFVNRSLFIHLLPASYLSLNGLFSNILSFLSLAELGIGSAINFALYRPLKEQDTETLRSIMALYRRLYVITGLIVLTAGSLLAPFLPHLIKGMPDDMQHIYLYFILYLANSGLSYFFTYKRSLIICDQKEYITTVITTLSNILLKITQMFVLVFFQDYTAYICAMIGASLWENLVISAAADKMYPFLKEKNAKKPAPAIIRDIKKNVYALVFQRIGEIVVYATDNIIISRFVGFASVGLYSNYTLIIQAVQMAAYRFFDSITASIGDLVAADDKEHVEKILYRILFINAWMFCFCSVCLLCLLQPFIQLWIGASHLLPGGTVVIIVVNFYLEGMRATVVTFRRAMGFHWQLRYKPIIEGILNLAVSIPLAIRFGIAGTLLGTIISTMCVSAVIEPYMLFRYYFQKKPWRFMSRQIGYAATTSMAALLTIRACRLIHTGPLTGFFIRICLCSLIPHLCMILVYRKNDEQLYLKRSVVQFIKKRTGLRSKY